MSLLVTGGNAVGGYLANVGSSVVQGVVQLGVSIGNFCMSLLGQPLS